MSNDDFNTTNPLESSNSTVRAPRRNRPAQLAATRALTRELARLASTLESVPDMRDLGGRAARLLLLEECPLPTVQPGVTWLQVIVERMLASAARGNVRAFIAVLERAYGKPGTGDLAKTDIHHVALAVSQLEPQLASMPRPSETSARLALDVASGSHPHTTDEAPVNKRGPSYEAQSLDQNIPTSNLPEL